MGGLGLSEKKDWGYTFILRGGWPAVKRITLCFSDVFGYIFKVISYLRRIGFCT